MVLSIFIALLITLFTIILPYFFSGLRYKQSILLTYWIILLVHQMIAFIDAFWFPVFGAEYDAISFHSTGEMLALSGNFYFGNGSRFYENFLGVIYWFLGPSKYLGNQLSVLAFSFSCLVLVKLLNLLGLLRYASVILLFYGLLPTMVFLGSVTLRESFQVLFFMLAVYLGMKAHIIGGLNRYAGGFFISLFCLGLLHSALLMYASFLIILYLLWSPYSGNLKKFYYLLIALPVVFLGLYLLMDSGLPGLGILRKIRDMEVIDAILSYRARLFIGRSSYDIILDFSSFFMSLYSLLSVYLYYLFYPLPWHIIHFKDLYACFESIIRFILIYYSIKNWYFAFGIQKRLFGLMLILFFSMSFLWSMGTSNYGTGTRHHMLDWWILVILGMPKLIDSLKVLGLRYLNYETKN